MTGPQPALAELFQSHRQGLTGAVRGVLGGSADVAEVLQDAFLKCWTAALHGDAPRDPVAWIFVVTWNVAVDARRRGQRRPPHATLDGTLDEETEMKMATETSPSAALERGEQLAAAQAAIEGLEDREKQVFLLRVSGGLTFEAVAEALAIPVGTAKTRMRKALQSLRRSLGISIPERS